MLRRPVPVSSEPPLPAAHNSARAAAIFATNTCDAFSAVWVYWAGPMAGSVMACFLHGIWFPTDTHARVEERLQPIVPGSSA